MGKKRHKSTKLGWESLALAVIMASWYTVVVQKSAFTHNSTLTQKPSWSSRLKTKKKKSRLWQQLFSKPLLEVIKLKPKQTFFLSCWCIAASTEMFSFGSWGPTFSSSSVGWCVTLQGRAGWNHLGSFWNRRWPGPLWFPRSRSSVCPACVAARTSGKLSRGAWLFLSWKRQTQFFFVLYC